MNTTDGERPAAPQPQAAPQEATGEERITATEQVTSAAAQAEPSAGLPQFVLFSGDAPTGLCTPDGDCS